MRSIGELKEFIRTDMLEKLSEIDNQRKAVLAYGKKLALAVIGYILFIFTITKTSSDSGSFVLILIGIAGIGIAIYLWKRKYSAYVEDYKENIIGRIVKFIDNSLEYSPSYYIEEDKFLNSNMFNTSPDRYTGSDYVSGKIGYTEIEFSFIHAQYKTETTYTDDDGHRHTEEHWHTIFKGIFLIADFNKHFNTQVLIWPDRSINLLKGIKKKFAFLSGWQVINLEDPEFDRYFIAYGEDQIEARYILSTSLVKRIIDYRKKINKDLYISFKNSNMYVAIPWDYPFSPVLFRSIMNYGLLHEYYETLSMIISIVEDLNLNTRIWSKQPVID
jgi:hypothetical protein